MIIRDLLAALSVTVAMIAAFLSLGRSVEPTETELPAPVVYETSREPYRPVVVDVPRWIHTSTTAYRIHTSTTAYPGSPATPEEPVVATTTVPVRQPQQRPIPTTTTTTTTTLPPAPPTLAELIGQHFEMEDWAWALRVAFCESSAQPDHTVSTAIHPSSRASGWFQHLPKFWGERTEAAGIPGADIMDPVANVTVAAYLLYETPQGKGHWYPSEHCWS